MARFFRLWGTRITTRRVRAGCFRGRLDLLSDVVAIKLAGVAVVR
jgi:hypothetical protein